MPRLATQTSGGNHLDDQRTGSEFLSQCLVQVPQHRQASIPTCQIAEFQRPHRMVETHAQRSVDIFGRRRAFLQHVHGFVTK